MNYLDSLVMLTLDLLPWYYLLLVYDIVVDKDNPNMYVLLKNTMLRHRNRIDMVHLLEKNDLQMNFDRWLDQMMIFGIFSYYYYLLDRLNNHHRMLKKMDHMLLLMMVRVLKVNLVNHRRYSMMMWLVELLLVSIVGMKNRMT
jgi:hypothetical protein